jgi:hypothetical protein
VRRGGEDGHGDADLGDEFLSGAPAHAGDLIESVHRRRERGDQLLHLGVEMCDVDVEGVDAPQHRGADEGVMVFEMAGERWSQLGNLDAHPSKGHVGEHVRITLSGDHCLEHLAARDPMHVSDDRAELDLSVFEDLLQALFLPGLLTDEAAPVSGDIAQLTDRLGMDQTGPAHGRVRWFVYVIDFRVEEYTRDHD